MQYTNNTFYIFQRLFIMKHREQQVLLRKGSYADSSDWNQLG